MISAKLSSPSPKLSELRLDVLRAAAAMLVVVGHWRILVFLDYPVLAAPSPALKLLYFVTGLGRVSVMLFFVLSGYLVTASALRSIDKGTWSAASYLNQRITRLMVVLLPALALCWLWDSLGLRFFPHGLYDGTIHTAALAADLSARRNLWTFVQNGAFLQGITARTYGSDDPLWSLSYEFWYYMLLIPLIWMVRQRALIRRSGAALLFFGGLCFVGRTISLYFIVWLLGAAVALAVRSQVRLVTWVTWIGLPASTLAMAAAMVLIRMRYLADGFAGYFALGCACSLFVCNAVCRDGKYRPNLFTRGSKSVAGWSYSLYLLHMPFLLFAASIIVRGRQWYPDARHLFLASPILLLAMAYSYGISRLTECHTTAVRSFVSRAKERFVKMPLTEIDFIYRAAPLDTVGRSVSRP